MRHVLVVLGIPDTGVVYRNRDLVTHELERFIKSGPTSPGRPDWSSLVLLGGEATGIDAFVQNVLVASGETHYETIRAPHGWTDSALRLRSRWLLQIAKSASNWCQCSLACLLFKQDGQTLPWLEEAQEMFVNADVMTRIVVLDPRIFKPSETK